MKDEGSEPGSICRNHVVKMQGRILKRTMALGSNRQCHLENLRILKGLRFFLLFWAMAAQKNGVLSNVTWTQTCSYWLIVCEQALGHERVFAHGKE